MPRLTFIDDLNTSVTQEQKDKLDEVANERGITRAALLRQFLWIGYKCDTQMKLDFDSDENSSTVQTDPYKSIFESHLPDSESEAIGIEELKEEILSDVGKQVMRLYREYENVELADNGGVYRGKS